LTALLDGQVGSSFVGNGVRVAGRGVGGDPPGALGTFELARAEDVSGQAEKSGTVKGSDP